MPWEHHTQPLASGRVFAGRIVNQLILVIALVAVALGIGVIGYMTIGGFDFVDSFLEASMMLGGAGPLYTERSSPNDLKLFSSLYSLFSTLIVVSTVALLAAPIIHRVLHRLHLDRSRR